MDERTFGPLPPPSRLISIFECNAGRVYQSFNSIFTEFIRFYQEIFLKWYYLEKNKKKRKRRNNNNNNNKIKKGKKKMKSQKKTRLTVAPFLFLSVHRSIIIII